MVSAPAAQQSHKKQWNSCRHRWKRAISQGIPMVFQIILKNLHKNNGILAVIGGFVQTPKEL